MLIGSLFGRNRCGDLRQRRKTPRFKREILRPQNLLLKLKPLLALASCDHYGDFPLDHSCPGCQHLLLAHAQPGCQDCQIPGLVVRLSLKSRQVLGHVGRCSVSAKRWSGKGRHQRGSPEEYCSTYLKSQTVRSVQVHLVPEHCAGQEEGPLLCLRTWSGSVQWSSLRYHCADCYQ